MDFAWSPRKARENLKKHGVDFADAVIALEDENALTIEDRGAYELRFKTLGMGPYTKVLSVVHTERGENSIRIISARLATKHETKQYFQGLDWYG